jgi:DNA-directed RNA polymerase subunit RPC12/RpoP
MRNVLCPRCKTEHRLPNDATGYTCDGCGTEWVFAKCAQCHSTFHAPARTAAWTCKRCGFRNVRTPEPEPEPEPEREKGPGLLQRAHSRWSALSQRGKLIAVAAPIALILIVVIAVLASGGGGPSQAAQLAAAKASYCLHSHALAQELDRGPAVNRAATQIKKDAALFRQAGDPATARQLKAIAREARKLAAADLSNKNVDATSHALLKKITQGPNC